jgi:hypothetical protein
MRASKLIIQRDTNPMSFKNQQSPTINDFRPTASAPHTDHHIEDEPSTPWSSRHATPTTALFVTSVAAHRGTTHEHKFGTNASSEPHGRQCPSETGV